MQAFLQNHSERFNLILKQGKPLFLKVYPWVCTRCFGFGFDHIFMAPFADCLNHSHDKQNTFYFVNKKLHVKPVDSQSSYCKDDKHKIDMSLIYQSGSEEDAAALKNKVVRGATSDEPKKAQSKKACLADWQ